MTPMKFFFNFEEHRWRREGILAELPPAARQVVLASARPSRRVQSNGETVRCLGKYELMPEILEAAASVRLPLDRTRYIVLRDATYDVSRMRDWEERRVQGAIRRGILPAPHDGYAIEDRLRPLVEPCDDLRWCRKPLGARAALACSGIVPNLRERADHPRRLRAEAAIRRGIVPTDSVEITFVTGGSYGVRDSQSVERPGEERQIHRMVQLDRRRWDEVMSLGLDGCENGLVLTVRHAVADDPWGRIFEVEAAQRGHKRVDVKERVMYALAAYDGRIRLFADQGEARAELAIVEAHYAKEQALTDTQETLSAEDAAALAELEPGAG
jgi:hypothetical protein